MAKQVIGIGTTANDGTGDSLRVSAEKSNDNFTEVYTLLGDGTTLPSGIVTTLARWDEHYTFRFNWKCNHRRLRCIGINSRS